MEISESEERIRVYGDILKARWKELEEDFRIGRCMYPEITLMVEFPLPSDKE